MSGTKLMRAGATILAEVLQVIQAPGGNMLTLAVQAIEERRREEAVKILAEEISSGKHGPVDLNGGDLEPFAEMVLRLNKAVEDGAARANIRILARVLAGLTKFKAPSADPFRRWCAALEHMTRSELLLVGKAHGIWQSVVQNAEEKERSKLFWRALLKEMESSGFSGDETVSLCAAIVRTGLLVPVSAFGGLNYRPAPDLADLAKLASLDEFGVV